ncbi:3-deoxy-D-manno-octulosonic acid kinase [Vibrio sp. OPT18]|uniref:3-deoxy-D-manno-octulosonic acid kinase n=1 Tax=Vibrio sp. OPT18 TaxID=2778641 RepID=UPI00187F96E7|nr:3-deoxy-D-manno-octulosonic acid kinase [Vibrio sp. OPT18]MBE8578955.1 3-deoxy-D-manno-octulosonic acid kinase [Vibrio sp. OPT18]
MTQVRTIGSQKVWFDETLVNDDIENIFDIDYWEDKDCILGSALGRGTTWFVQTQFLPAALRHYRRGGLLGKLVSDQYFFVGWQKSRSCQEFHLLNLLRSKGVNVPRPIAARAIKNGLFYRADLLSEKIPNAQDLVAILEQQSLASEAYYDIGIEIAKMHQAQVNHTDLNIHNILLDSSKRVWIIDFDKCTRMAGSTWKNGNLERLKRSFLKEKVKRSIHWEEREFQCLLDGYEASQ